MRSGVRLIRAIEPCGCTLEYDQRNGSLLRTRRINSAALASRYIRRSHLLQARSSPELCLSQPFGACSQHARMRSQPLDGPRAKGPNASPHVRSRTHTPRRLASCRVHHAYLSLPLVLLSVHANLNTVLLVHSSTAPSTKVRQQERARQLATFTRVLLRQCCRLR